MPSSPRRRTDDLVGADMGSLGDGAFGLLDHDPAVQRSLKLRAQTLRVLGGFVVEQGERGGVGERLSDDDICC